MEFDKKRRHFWKRKRADLVAQLQASHISEDFAQERAILEKIMEINDEIKATGGEINE